MTSNGTIITAKLLDREAIPIYNLIVAAKDLAKQPEPQLSATVQVKIDFTLAFQSMFPNLRNHNILKLSILWFVDCVYFHIPVSLFTTS